MYLFKTIVSKLSFSLIIAMLFISCGNNIATAPDSDMSDINDVKLNSIEDLNLVVDNLNKVTSYEALKKFQNKTSKLGPTKIQKIKEALQPLSDKGEEFKKRLEENTTDKKLKSGISDLNEKETMLLGLVSLIHDELKQNNSTVNKKTMSKVDGEKIVSCASAALGIQSVKTIISGTAELMTAKTALKIVKTLGKRYLGYAGVAIAVYEFTKCIS